jgi:hypothetical protein
MLANVMPGLRELRAPLAAGYLWLLWGWLAFGARVPRTKDEAPEPLHRLYELEPVISDLGLAVVASVAAYVLGSIVVDVQAQFTVIPRWLDATTIFSLAPAASRPVLVTPAGRRILDSIFEQSHSTQRQSQESTHPQQLALSQVSGVPPAPPRPRTVNREEALRIWLSRNREVLKTRLLDLSTELHSEVDRPDAEATFRMALWPPLAALTLYPLAAQVSGWWLGALVIPALLAWQWISLRRQATESLVAATAARPELQEMFVEGVEQTRQREETRLTAEGFRALRARYPRDAQPSSPADSPRRKPPEPPGGNPHHTRP